MPVGDEVVLLEGEMLASPDSSPSKAGMSSSSSKIPELNLDTLDEPISETLMRDLTGIVTKVRHVILPTSKSDAYKSILKDWDLWGPLVMCTFFCLTLNHDTGKDGSKGPHFAEIFLLVWLGFYAVGINFKLLAVASRRRSTSSGSSTPAQSGRSNFGVYLVPPSIFQLICVFGYCLASPCLGVILVKILEGIVGSQMRHLFYEKLLIGLLFGFVWPTYSALRILSRFQSKDKQLLASYPIGLLYFIVSWFIISAH